MVEFVDWEAKLDELWIAYRDTKGSLLEKNHRNGKVRSTLLMHYKNELAQFEDFNDRSKFLDSKMDKLKKKHGRKRLYWSSWAINSKTLMKDI